MEARITEGYFIREKLYAYKTEEGEIIITSAGVKEGLLNFEDFKTLISGQNVQVKQTNSFKSLKDFTVKVKSSIITVKGLDPSEIIEIGPKENMLSIVKYRAKGLNIPPIITLPETLCKDIVVFENKPIVRPPLTPPKQLVLRQAQGLPMRAPGGVRGLGGNILLTPPIIYLPSGTSLLPTIDVLQGLSMNKISARFIVESLPQAIEFNSLTLQDIINLYEIYIKSWVYLDIEHIQEKRRALIENPSSKLLGNIERLLEEKKDKS